MCVYIHICICTNMIPCICIYIYIYIYIDMQEWKAALTGGNLGHRPGLNLGWSFVMIIVIVIVVVIHLLLLLLLLLLALAWACPITSLPFVHSSRRSYRLSDPVNNSDCRSACDKFTPPEDDTRWNL